jgi:hypothetical protein
MFLVTLGLGAAVVTAIALSPLYGPRLRPIGSQRLGAGLVLLAVGLAFASSATSPSAIPPGTALFVVVFVLMLLGALCILFPDDDPDDPRDAADDEPPWWPEFEAGFDLYARRRRKKVPTR